MGRLQRMAIERIQTVMARKNWGINELARRAGMDGGYLSKVLSLKIEPSLGTLDKLSGALGSPILRSAGRTGKEYSLAFYRDRNERRKAPYKEPDPRYYY